jgi:hypothetical protein
MSYDERFLLTAGGDGQFGLYRVNVDLILAACENPNLAKNKPLHALTVEAAAAFGDDLAFDPVYSSTVSSAGR